MTAPARLLREAGLPDHEARRLLTAATGLDRAELARLDQVPAEASRRFAALVARRKAGEPLQYLEGGVAFGSLDLKVDGRALIPRPETEQLWEMAAAALGEAGPGTVIVDLCTGSGNLALALKHSFPAARVYGVDASRPALALARENAARTDLDVTFLHGDLFEPLPDRLRGRIDLLVANPPYVSEPEYADLAGEIIRHEPKEALVAGPGGDEVLTRLGAEAYWWLGVGGWLFVEIGATQSDRALEVFEGFNREVRSDLAGQPRFLVGRRGASCCR